MSKYIRMKKLSSTLSFLLASLALVLGITGCNFTAATDAEFTQAAQQRDCRVSASTFQKQWTATYRDCTFEFLTFDSSDTANDKFDELVVIGKKIKSQAASTNNKQVNVPWQHHYMVKTATQFFYLTQIGSTVFYANTHRRCEEKVTEVAEILKY